MADKSIRQLSAIVEEMSADWAMVDALMEGTQAMREGAKAWLPQWPRESEEGYQARLKTAVLHPVFKRTVLVNAARPFSKPITLGDKTPANVIEWTGDIDLEGTNLAAFAVQRMGECLSKGLTGVLIDFPKATEIRTQAEEKSAGVRPYCVHYPANSILGWKTAKGSDGKQLSQLRLLEFIEADAGEFGTKTVEQVRLLTPGAWSTYQEDEKDKEIWNEIESGVTSLNFIPFVFFYGIRKAFGVGCSPLRDLAYQNIEHWQSACDQQTILHVARVPILFAKLMDAAEITVGAGGAACSENEKSDLKYVEHSGAAIDAGKESLIDLQDRMRATGAELISLDTAYTTATQVSSDSEATKSLMQQICENFEESLQLCLDYMSAWVSGEKTSEVELYKDFGTAVSEDPGTLSSAANGGTISKQTHFEELQRRDVVSADRTWDEEKLRLGQETTQAANDAANAAATLAKATPRVDIGNA